MISPEGRISPAPEGRVVVPVPAGIPFLIARRQPARVSLLILMGGSDPDMLASPYPTPFGYGIGPVLGSRNVLLHRSVYPSLIAGDWYLHSAAGGTCVVVETLTSDL